MNETHAFKNNKIHANVTMIWIKTNYHVMTIVIFISNDAKNFANYLSFIEFFQTKKWWFKKFLKTMNFDFEEFSFDSKFDKHEIIKLKYIVRVVKNFIFTSNIENLQKEINFKKIWIKIMLRRTHFNKISFNNTRTIKNELFDLKFVLVFCQFI